MDRIEYISPSAFKYWQDCPYRAVLLKTHATQINADSALGSLIHEFYQKYTSWGIDTEEKFLSKWNERIGELNSNNLQLPNFSPIEWYSKYYIIKRNYLIKRLIRSTQIKDLASQKGCRFYHEYELQNSFIKGRADLIIKDDNLIKTIVDFKTGSIFEYKSKNIKESYRTQLALYAFIVYENQQTLPDLLLETVDGKRHKIVVSKEEILKLGDEAKQLLEDINDCIANNSVDTLERHSANNCKWCYEKSNCKYCEKNL